MSKWSSKRIAILAAIIALNVALSYVVHIPIPATSGFVNLVEAGIFIAALSMGPGAGLLVGAFSGALLDLFAGYPQWLLFSFVIHGLEGYIAGLAIKRSGLVQAIALLLASIVMIIGYVLAGSFLYNWAAGWASIFGNFGQCFFGAIVALAILPVLKKRLASR
ncbi:ECF transporter S component [Fructobacillus fructosus]|uniref:ECF transporter S component n=1 Tax=Fructobacillus fructosus TaxID=1631 RepID=UPI00165873C5|nr:ECF transporter S component [Fructobacillus fructosus]MBC9118660.1 ECF transporter S component [Fructobacillus fructosus]MBD9365324.1 ECF transporter S component [Leuconostoc mesenteroides]MCK8637972.1 ECF transporter S component [Fructobacillus fructosus]CAK1236186.1 ECF-type riboflavin transporter [Fructobacillus fructosus]